MKPGLKESVICIGTAVVGGEVLGRTIRVAEKLVEHFNLPRLPVVLITGGVIFAGIHGAHRLLFEEQSRDLRE